MSTCRTTRRASSSARPRRRLEIELLEGRNYPGSALPLAQADFLQQLLWSEFDLFEGLQTINHSLGLETAAIALRDAGVSYDLPVRGNGHWLHTAVEADSILSETDGTDLGASLPDIAQVDRVISLLADVSVSSGDAAQPIAKDDGSPADHGVNLLDAHDESTEGLDVLFDGHSLGSSNTTHHLSWREHHADASGGATINFFIDTSDQGAGQMPAAIPGAVRSAAQTWNQDSSAVINEVNQLSLTHVKIIYSSTSPCGSNPTTPPPDGSQLLGCTDYVPNAQIEGWLPDGTEGVQHHWHRWRAIQNVTFLTLSNGYTWGSNQGGGGPEFDSEAVAVHELGHVLGLAEQGGTPSDPDTVMQEYPGSGVAVRRSPSVLDRQDVTHLYTSHECPLGGSPYPPCNLS